MSELTAHALGVARAAPGLLREVAQPEPEPVLVAGAPSAATDLRRVLVRGGDPGLVRRISVLDLAGDASGAALVYVIRGTRTSTDERALREADWRGLPTVCLLLEDTLGDVLPYVAATDVVRAPRVDEGAVAAVARRLAARAGESAWPLARELPALRAAAGEALVAAYARRGAALAGLPGAGPAMPALTLAELRLLLRVAAMHGVELRGGVGMLPLAGVTGAALGFRALARRLGSLAPLPPAVVHALVAYAGVQLVGRAARAAFARS